MKECYKISLPLWCTNTLQLCVIPFLIFVYLSTGLEGQMIRASQGSTRAAEDEVLYVANTTTTRLLTLGYDQAAADLIWLRTIQYFVRHLMFDRRYRWLEHFVNQIIELDPQFKQVYLWAASCILYGQEITPARVLSSNRFYLLALDRFPEDYEAAYRLGMNYYSELRSDNPQERERHQNIGISYFERAAHAPNAPPSVLSLIKGLAKRTGRHEVLFYALSDELFRTSDPQRRTQLEEKLKRLSEVMGQSGEMNRLIQQAQERERIRQKKAPYLNPLDFDLLESSTPHHQGWRDLIEVF